MTLASGVGESDRWYRPADISRYVTMPDGVRIAMSVWFARPGQDVPGPVVFIQTRYGRASPITTKNFAFWPAEGYHVASIDVRGTTASFGERRLEINQEAPDMRPLIEYIAAQPWSNGEVFAAGQSYLADTADVAAAQGAPALKAAVLRHSEFDVVLDIMQPGGIYNKWMMENYGRWTLAMDEGRSLEDPRIDCRARAADCKALYPLLTPVDGDSGYELLRQALTSHRRWPPDAFANTVYIDDRAANGETLFGWSPAVHMASIRRNATPVLHWGSWLDAGTAAAALERFRSAPEVPAELWLTANDHSEKQLTDPFFPDRSAPLPSIDEQRSIMTGFLARVRAHRPVGRQIHYYVLGAGQFRTTDVWPPAGVQARLLHLTRDHSLAERAPSESSLHYSVDFGATSGTETRWTANLGTPARYADRRDLQKRLLTFTSTPFTRATELVGYPVVHLLLASESTDPALHVYLDDIAPDGRMTYLTEGMIRLIHRAPARPEGLPYDRGAAPHSFARADGKAMTPGRLQHLDLALLPVAALIGPGHSVRVSIAGADAGNFQLYSNGGPDTYTVAVGGDKSTLELPLRPWTETRD
ncbi:MAG TPA: CocE/NonD family hydrolase [Steroidobacteraceae bacterium]|nr:CocE/NonD family hydrolase [Steroidobacteraceae bacterium]